MNKPMNREPEAKLSSAKNSLYLYQKEGYLRECNIIELISNRLLIFAGLFNNYLHLKAIKLGPNRE